MRRTLALTNKNMTRWCAADIRAKRWGRMSDGQMAQRSSVLEACARQGGSVRIASTSSDVNQVIAVRPAPARRSLSLRRLVVACVPIFPSACPPSCPALDLHRPCPPVRRWAVVGLVCTRRAIACRDWWRRRGGTCAGCLCSFRCTKSRWRSRSCARRIHSRCALPQCRRTAQHECLLSLRPAALHGARCEWCAVRLSAAVCRGADDRGNPRRTTVADARTCLGPPRWPHAPPARPQARRARPRSTAPLSGWPLTRHATLDRPHHAVVGAARWIAGSSAVGAADRADRAHHPLDGAVSESLHPVRIPARRIHRLHRRINIRLCAMRHESACSRAPHRHTSAAVTALPQAYKAGWRAATSTTTRRRPRRSGLRPLPA